MDVVKRMQLIRIIEKMEKNPEFSENLGIRNKSALKPVKERK
ncbi:hypothetical protein [Anaerostipes faecalis]|nr:hypothetical protein [Anaerostipes faecalis]